MAKQADLLSSFPDGAAEPIFRRPIDLVHLARQTLGDKGLECEVLRMFDQIALAYLDRLRAAVNSDDIKLSLHSLKGAAAGVGADVIAAHARLAEGELLSKGAISEERIADLAMVVHETSAYIAEILEA
jgi:HPt (histidine-containing phosphotransfer) domain-containing protein